MPIEIIVDDINQVDESVRGAYVEADGKYQIDPDKYHELRATGLKRKNQELIDKQKELKARSARFERFENLDDDTLHSLLDSLEQSNEQNGDAKQGEQKKPGVNIDRVKARYEEQLKQRDEQISELNAKVREFSIWTPVRELASKAGALPDRLDAFVKLLRTDGRFDLNDAGQLVFKEADGYVSDHKPDKAFTILKEEYPYFFAASGAAGSGATPGANGGTYQKIDYSKLSPVERINAARRLK